MSYKILVVEDSRTFRKYLCQQLSALGFEIVDVGSYKEAEHVLEQQDDFLFALLDYCLPDAENGEVIDLVLNRQQKVIVLTATFNEHTREHFISKGVVDYILKESTSSVSYVISLAKRLMNNPNHHALVVDDSPTVRKHISSLLEHQYIKTTQAENGQQALDILQRNPDITFVISDHDMPEKDGITMTKEIRQIHDKNSMAILGVSGSNDRTMTARFLKAGANDFLHKPFNHEEFYCRIHQMLDMKEARDELFKLANQDALTGLWNRRYLFEQTCKNCHDRSVAMVDIDYFKKVNDVYGHDGGDAALLMVANILKIYFANDTIVRFGGEEFCIVNCGPYDDFVTRLEQMRQRVEKTPISHQGSPINLTVSIGANQQLAPLAQQITGADDRLYQAKEAGRNKLIYQ
ncbi:response regulator [Vibrio sp. TRT 17S01]|uniref:response regulator n=1 Tax=Vibrio sp. TRT 17S01 TaxID=3418505 RepID=UPI003CF64BA2